MADKCEKCGCVAECQCCKGGACAKECPCSVVAKELSAVKEENNAARDLIRNAVRENHAASKRYRVRCGDLQHCVCACAS
ncbi:unnamed protein product [Cylicocyclus nassatus]|uniref:Uncharacterized protein n=1 Tax=Cylicocyclus nassatus TaxID=53992 RepID=A0AA36GWD5_CYLNA|nr:unnamed protein product [Cylicocyclus nassatus]